MALAYVVAPYLREFTADWNRRCALDEFFGPQRPGQRPWEQPFREVEILGDHALALVDADAATLSALSAVNGIVGLPRVTLTTPLSELTLAERREVRDLALGLGYTLDEIKAWAGRTDGDLGSLTLRQVLGRLATRRRRPQVNEHGDLTIDGPERPCNPVPLPVAVGGAFEDGETLLDDFNRASLGANWGGTYVGSGAAMVISGSTVLVSGAADASNSSNFYSAADLGPACRAHVLIPAGGNNGRLWDLMLRVVNAGTASADGYRVRLTRNVGTDTWASQEVTNGSGVTIGSTVALEFSVGERIGLECDGTSIDSYHYSGSTWALVTDRTDATHSAAGKVAIFTNSGGVQFDDLYAWTISAGGTEEPLNQATETDTALGITGAKTKALGHPAETDEALGLTGAKTKALGIASSTDAAQALSGAKARALGLPSETDTALPVTGAKSLALGQATTTETALPLTAQKTLALGIAAESDTALGLNLEGAGVIEEEIGQPSETDAALPLTGAKVMTLGQAIESETALPFTAVKAKALGQATETDAALPALRLKTLTLGVAAETADALAFASVKTLALGLATEADAALAFTGYPDEAGVAVVSGSNRAATTHAGRPRAATTHTGSTRPLAEVS